MIPLKHNRNYWVISDTHFFHENILKWEEKRASLWKTAHEMNEGLIENWNKVVKQGDKVYHLGDVWMGPSTHEERAKLIARLQGSKRLIVGNHDDIPYMAKGGWFKKVSLWRVFNEFNCLLTHVPVHEASIHERIVTAGGYNVCGHTHSKGAPPGPYFSVCVENINFTPINLEEIRDKMK